MTDSVEHHPHTHHRAHPAHVAVRRLRALGHVALVRKKWLSRLLIGFGASFTVLVALAIALWWRLNSGPIEFDVATPWLKAAIQQNFGAKHTVSVGGTQIERTEKGGASVRLLDVVVRDDDGTVVASAPKAEIGISGTGLLTGQLRAQSLNLVGAETAIRIEPDGRLTVFAGADKRPIVSAAVPRKPQVPAPSDTSVPAGTPASAEGASQAGGLQEFAAILGWIDNLGETGLDGQELREVGLKDGHLTVDDRRNGKQLSFDHINVSLTRPRQGGLMFKLESENGERPWVINAAIRPLGEGVRALGIEARNVSIRDLLLAMRMNDPAFSADFPISASIRADIAPDGTPQLVNGELLADAGSIVSRDDPDIDIDIDRALVRFNWDLQRHTFIAPFQIRSGGNQFTLRANVEPPTERESAWVVTMSRDDPVIDPVILGAPMGSEEEALALNRANVRLRIDLAKKRIELDQADLRRSDTRPGQNIAAAVTGSLDFNGADPRLAFGVAANRMPGWALTRMWPSFITADVRRWVVQHITGGTVERLVIAGNAPLPEYNPKGPPLSDDGLSLELETSGTAIKPVATLPAIRDADLSLRIVGRNVAINVGRGTVDVGGRRLNVSNGLFQVPDTHPKPAQSRTTFKIDGTLPAVAALLASDGLRDSVGLPLDPAGMRGTVSAQVQVDTPIGKGAPKDAATYSIAADLTNFGADKLLFGQKVEAAGLKVNASNMGYQLAGDVKIAGTPAKIDLSKAASAADAELHLAANVDEASRRRMGLDVGSAITGSIPVRLTAHVNSDMSDVRSAVEADLSPVRIDDLLPGWEKPPGKPAHASFTFYKNAKITRLEDLALDGGGVNVKGAIELDAAGDVTSADFPVFSLSDGDKASLKAERVADGALRVVMRGDVYDGRNFVRSAMSGEKENSRQKQSDIDLDVKLGVVAGYNGEALRGVSLRLARRGGRVRSFNLESKVGRDSPLVGDMRVRARDNHAVLFFETSDAGALFRLTDFYPRMYGGQMWIAMDPPAQDQPMQSGTLYIHDFVVRNEPALQRVLSNGPSAPGAGVDFTELHADFTRGGGRMSIRDGIVRGPVLGITVEGQIDYAHNDTHLRGTFVPFYGLNNMFGQIPIVGIFLGGGSNEGLLGITYEAVGPPSAPRVNINPVTAITPGLLRKFVPSPGMADPGFNPQPR
jgi:Protein of unknown function